MLRPGGLVVYTVRHTGDAHHGTGTPRGDDMYEHGGFIVHFFDDRLVQRLASGFDLLDVTELTELTEGDLTPPTVAGHHAQTRLGAADAPTHLHGPAIA